MPRARTPRGWLALGLSPDLHEATGLALDGILDVLVEQYHVERKYALALASVVVDLRVTQIANGTLGVHAFLADGAIRL